MFDTKNMQIAKEKIFFTSTLDKSSGGGLLNYKFYSNFKLLDPVKIKRSNLIKSIILYKKSKYIYNSDICLVTVLIFLITKILRKKNIYAFHGFIPKDAEYNRILKFYASIIYTLADRVIFYSPRIFDRNCNVFPYNYIDRNKLIFAANPSENISESTLDVAISNEFFNIITIGGGRPIKGVLGVCQAISMLESSSLIKLHVFGRDGDDTSDIKNYKFVEYHGGCSRDVLLSYMSNVDLYIQNSESETFCQSIIESAQVGCNFICSANIGAIDAFDDIEKNLFEYNDYLKIGELIKLSMIGKLSYSFESYNQETTSVDSVINALEIGVLSA